MNIGMRILAAAVLSAAISFPASAIGARVSRRLREPRRPPAIRLRFRRHPALRLRTRGRMARPDSLPVR